MHGVKASGRWADFLLHGVQDALCLESTRFEPQNYGVQQTVIIGHFPVDTRAPRAIPLENSKLDGVWGVSTMNPPTLSIPRTMPTFRRDMDTLDGTKVPGQEGFREGIPRNGEKIFASERDIHKKINKQHTESAILSVTADN